MIPPNTNILNFRLLRIPSEGFTPRLFTDELTVAVQPPRIGEVEALAVALAIDYTFELEHALG